MQIQLNNKTFDRAFTISPSGLKNINRDKLSIEEGVYVVVYRHTVQYVGKFTCTLKHRWINFNKNSNCVRTFRHQKGPVIYKKVRDTGHSAHVYVRQDSNPDSLEVSLIKKLQPNLNIQHNR